MEDAYHDNVATPALKAYKERLFGRSDFILHTADIVRRQGVFHRLTDVAFRARFYEETNALMTELEYVVVACVILKDDHFARYGMAALDPYMLSLKVLVERFVFEIQARGRGTSGHIVAEARDETLNNELRLAWVDLRTSGTEYVSAADVREHVEELYIRDKKRDIAGLQIADLIVSPIGRHVLGRRAREDWAVIERKLRKGPGGSYWGYGLVTLPKKK